MEYKHKYKVRKWFNIEERENTLNTMTNEGWLVDNHYFNTDKSKGWTIFRKTEKINGMLLDRDIPLRVLYGILNSSECSNDFMSRKEVIETIDKRIKEYIEKEDKV